jgi:hypothetical protein
MIYDEGSFITHETSAFITCLNIKTTIIRESKLVYSSAKVTGGTTLNVTTSQVIRGASVDRDTRTGYKLGSTRLIRSAKENPFDTRIRQFTITPIINHLSRGYAGQKDDKTPH